MCICVVFRLCLSVRSTLLHIPTKIKQNYKGTVFRNLAKLTGIENQKNGNGTMAPKRSIDNGHIVTSKCKHCLEGVCIVFDNSYRMQLSPILYKPWRPSDRMYYIHQSIRLVYGFFLSSGCCPVRFWQNDVIESSQFN